MPQIAEVLSLQCSYSGGWLLGLLNELENASEINLAIAFPIVGTKNIIIKIVEEKKYYGFPVKKRNRNEYVVLQSYMESILSDYKPDIIHIWGTEFTHTLAMVYACEKQKLLGKTILSIQGLCSVIAKHYFANLPGKVVTRFTFLDFIKRNNIKQQQVKLTRRGQYEIEAIRKVHIIIGRTDWDNACTQLINANAQYHHCNETLRQSFYQYQWHPERCEKYSIFIS